MATTCSTGDPPPQPTTTVSTTTTTTKLSTVITSPLTRPTTTAPPHLQPRPPQFHHPYQVYPHSSSIQTQTTHILPHLGKPSDTIRYPLASSGRGLIPTHHRAGAGPGPGIHTQFPETVPVYPQIPSLGNQQQPNRALHSPHTHIIRPSFVHHHPSQPPAAVAPPTAYAGVQVHHPLSKVGSSPYSLPDGNAPKDLTDKKPDDALVTLRNRKVRISDGASLYALCRSWLKNGCPEEIQPQYGDVLMSLPKPLPLPESSSPKRKERDDETKVDEVDTNEFSSAEELLISHVKRAKRVRARLREERLRRIERYKSRLTLLLPPNGTIQE